MSSNDQFVIGVVILSVTFALIGAAYLLIETRMLGDGASRAERRSLPGDIWIDCAVSLFRGGRAKPAMIASIRRDGGTTAKAAVERWAAGERDVQPFNTDAIERVGSRLSPSQRVAFLRELASYGLAVMISNGLHMHASDLDRLTTVGRRLGVPLATVRVVLAKTGVRASERASRSPNRYRVPPKPVRRGPSPEQVLGVATGASSEEIRIAYRALAKRHHPDRHQGGDASSHKRMSEINAAYDALRRP